MDDDRVVAVGLGHPLIPETKRVDNDVNVGPKGQILMVSRNAIALMKHIGLDLKE